MKATVLKHAACLLYTPDREHFGIVPVEAMYAQVPVIAVNSGGPLESVDDGKTGYLRHQDPLEWAEVIKKICNDSKLRQDMGKAGRQRVKDRFSLEAFGKTLDTAVKELVAGKPKAG
mmetsp:Transcript_24357/g.59167  ORF Transcript_24357/g.59167 Transcript_24357/m.59167 type:complete len:117 (+) Transcript_24357:1-351(+)